MSEWFYIWLALGLTWSVLGGYMLMLNRRRIAAERAMRDVTGIDDSGADAITGGGDR